MWPDVLEDIFFLKYMKFRETENFFQESFCRILILISFNFCEAPLATSGYLRCIKAQ